MSVIKEVTESSSADSSIVRSVMTLPDGDCSGASFLMSFSACDNAACGCTNLSISLRPEGQEDPDDSLSEFTVDVRSKDLTSSDKNSEFAEQASRHFDDQDWLSLWRTFYDLKLECTEDLDIERTSAKFPMRNSIETEGELVAYSEILPHGRKFFAERSEGTVLLDEQYCLRSGCDCDTVAVCFIPIKDGKQNGEPAMTEVRYRTGKVDSSQDVGSFHQTPQELFQVFLSTYPDLLQQFSKRHKQLRQLYTAYRKSHSAPAQREVSKVGRNEPCPCGSGSKFKKCCGVNGSLEIGS